MTSAPDPFRESWEDAALPPDDQPGEVTTERDIPAVAWAATGSAAGTALLLVLAYAIGGWITAVLIALLIIGSPVMLAMWSRR